MEKVSMAKVSDATRRRIAETILAGNTDALLAESPDDMTAMCETACIYAARVAAKRDDSKADDLLDYVVSLAKPDRHCLNKMIGIAHRRNNVRVKDRIAAKVPVPDGAHPM